VVQVCTASPLWGLLAGATSGYCVAIVTFQIAFFLATFDMYRLNSRSFCDALKRFELDVIPIHIRAFSASMACYAVSLPICAALAMLIDHLPTWLRVILPISAVEMVLAISMFDLCFLASMSGFSSEYATRLAARYGRYELYDKPTSHSVAERVSRNW